MRRLHRLRRPTQEAELDITAFMNLMIVLVPILLLGMVFSRITVIGLDLPEQSSQASTDPADNTVELVLRESVITINYPRGIQLKTIPALADGTHDYAMARLVLQEVKRQLREKGIEKRAIAILAEPDTDYQTLVRTMDTVRSFKALVAASVVDAALFPEISLGEAPPEQQVSSL